MEPKLAAIVAVDIRGAPGPGLADHAANELALVQYELIDPTISRYGGRIFALLPATTLVEFAEPGHAVGCALEIQRGMAERDAELAPEGGVGLRIGVDLAEVLAVSGDLRGPAVVVAKELARIAPAGAVMISGRVARRIEPTKLRARSTDRGVHAVEGVARVALVELRPLAHSKAQSPWTLRRRWTWVAMIAAVVLLAGASLVLWRPVREWLLPMPTEAAADAPIISGAWPR